MSGPVHTVCYAGEIWKRSFVSTFWNRNRPHDKSCNFAAEIFLIFFSNKNPLVVDFCLKKNSSSVVWTANLWCVSKFLWCCVDVALATSKHVLKINYNLMTSLGFLLCGSRIQSSVFFKSTISNCSSTFSASLNRALKESLVHLIISNLSLKNVQSFWWRLISGTSKHCVSHENKSYLS